MANCYVENQITKVIEENKHSKYSLPLQITIIGGQGGTKWINISTGQALKISEMLAQSDISNQEGKNKYPLPPQIKIKGNEGGTKWINISIEQSLKIYRLLTKTDIFN